MSPVQRAAEGQGAVRDDWAGGVGAGERQAEHEGGAYEGEAGQGQGGVSGSDCEGKSQVHQVNVIVLIILTSSCKT